MIDSHSIFLLIAALVSVVGLIVLIAVVKLNPVITLFLTALALATQRLQRHPPLLRPRSPGPRHRTVSPRRPPRRALGTPKPRRKPVKASVQLSVISCQ